MDDNSRGSSSTAGTSESRADDEFTSVMDVEIVTPRKSVIWQSFTNINTTSAKCNECNKVFKCSSSSTTSLWRHMRIHNKGSTSETSNTEKITKLDRNSSRAKLLTDALAKMIIWDLEPFKVVEHRGFRHLMNIAAPDYEIPSRTTFSREIIPTIYVAEKNRIKQIILNDVNEGVSTLAFTTDGWTSRSVESYISLTVHYITKNFEAKQFTLAMVPLPENHTAKNLHAILKATIDEWNLNTELIRSVSFTTDNAANIVAAIRMSPSWLRIPCFAHTLQLAVKDTVQKFDEFLGLCRKAKSIVGFFSRSTTAHDKLAKAQENLSPEKTPLKLIQNVDTRWNSEYDMMARLLALKKSLTVVLCDKGMPANFSLSEWQRMEEYVNTLEPIKEATVLMSSEIHPTLSQYMPIVEMLKKAICTDDTTRDSMEIEDESDNDGENRFSTLLSTSLNNRLNFVNVCNDAIVFAMVLDPRFKDRLIKDPQEKRDVSERLCCKALMDTVGSLYSTDSPSQPCPRQMTESGEPKSKLQKLFDEALETDDAEVVDVERELPLYLCEKVLPRNTNVLDWWCKNQTRFPVLSQMAQQYLNVPASQTSSERLFSTAGNIVTPDRARLLAGHVEQLAFLNKNHE